MKIINRISMTEPTAKKFAEWLERYGKPGLDIKACQSHAEDEVGEQISLGDSSNWELGSFYSASGNPVIYRFSEKDFDIEWEEIDE